MKKYLIILILTLAVFSQTYAEEATSFHSSFNYKAIGIGPLPAPVLILGVGHRVALGEKGGLDIGVSGATLFAINTVRLPGDLLGYFGKQSNSQYFAGIRGTGGTIFGTITYDTIWYAAPNAVVGKEFINSEGHKRFFQVEGIYPVFSNNFTEATIPFFTLKYGFCF